MLKELNRLPASSSPTSARTHFADVDAGLGAGHRAARGAGVVIDLIPVASAAADARARARRARAERRRVAGAPPGADPTGRTCRFRVPADHRRAGRRDARPLFMSRAGAQRAIGARALDEREGAAHAPAAEISPRAVELFATQAEEVGDAAGFEFVPASGAIEFIQDYIRKDSEII